MKEAVGLLRSDKLVDTRAKSSPPVVALRESYLVGFLAASGHETEAQALLAESLQRFPSAWSLVRVKAALHVRDGQPELATATLRSYLARAWWHREARMFLADHIARHGRLADAAEEYLAAARLDIRSREPWEKLARMRAGASGSMPAQPHR
jgi:Flp pilus assembly protein TadD